MMIVQHNVLAMNTIRQLGIATKTKAKKMERLSSGYRINRAAEDAAGMAISEKMNSKMRALKRCQNNIEEGISLVQVADGALQEVNNMLVRVHELCVQAANGTNTQEDRGMLADEIKQIYDEMDHIFEYTEFNTMPVFRNTGINFNNSETDYTYTESVTRLPDGQYSEFGEIAGLQEKQFELAEEAKGASVTMTLDSDIDLNDASTLTDKKFFMEFSYEKNGVTYRETVRFDFSSTMSGSTSENGMRIMHIGVNNSMTVQDAFDKMCENCDTISEFKEIGIKSAVISQNKGENQVSLILEPQKLYQNFQVDGGQTGYSVVNGNGVIGNTHKIYSTEGVILEEIDSKNNLIEYSKDIHVDWRFYTPTAGTISAEQKEALKTSFLVLYLDGNKNRVSFTDAEVDALNDTDDLRQLLMEKLADMGCEVSFDGSDVVITKKDCMSATKSNSVAYIEEEKETGSEKYSNQISVSIHEVVAPTLEQAGEWVIELPENVDADMPFTLRVNNNIYTFYNAEKAWLRTTQSLTYAVYRNDIGMALENVFEDNIKDAVITVNDNKVTVKAKNANEKLDIVVESESVSYQSYGITPSRVSFDQDYSISFDLNEASLNNFEVSNYYGKGFVHNNILYEFSNNSNELSDEDAVRIDISSCTSYDEIAESLEKVLNQNNKYPHYYNYEVVNLTGVLEIHSSRMMKNVTSSSVYNPTYEDGCAGYDGVFNDTDGKVEKTFSGGTDTTQPYAALDFSNYTSENMSELYGKGFRITCATCPGEFVNVMFCEDKNTSEYPESFIYTDADGNTNEIKNHIVELKNIETGTQLVNNIVKQLENELDHYTSVEAENAKLVVKDKRAGNIRDLNGVLQRAEIKNGLLTNYEYKLEKVPSGQKAKKEYIGKDSKAYYSYVMIYGSDTSEDPYIPVHLPYLTLDNLKLEPITENFKDKKGIETVMKQAQNAGSIISKARSKIGADQNRLEHAFAFTTNAENQMTDAYSRIKDADMATELMANAKAGILQQVAQSMLSHVTQNAEQVLSLLQ